MLPALPDPDDEPTRRRSAPDRENAATGEPPSIGPAGRFAYPASPGETVDSPTRNR